MLYSFRKIGTEDIFELSMSMADREVYLTEHPEMEQVLVSAPALVDAMMLGRMNAAGKDFQRNVIDRMKHSIPHNQLHTSKLQTPREI